MHPLVYLIILLLVAGLVAVQYAVGGWSLAVAGIVGLAVGGALGVAIAKLEMQVRRSRVIAKLDASKKSAPSTPIPQEKYDVFTTSVAAAKAANVCDDCGEVIHGRWCGCPDFGKPANWRQL